jgi:hypothetical protein
MTVSDDLEQKIFLAVILHDSRRYRLYSLYFVNNTAETIDAMIVVAPGGMEALGEGSRLDDLGPDLVDNIAIRKYEGIPPRSYVELTTYFDWEFDWSSTRYIMLRTGGREEHLRFSLEKDLMAGQKLDALPVLGKSGYVCLGAPVALSRSGTPGKKA